MADLYRKSSIEKLSNPEQLDKTIKITSPMSWLALLGVLLIIVATVIWGFYGKLPETKTVSGMVVSTDNIGVLHAEESSIVKRINKEIGDKIEKGDSILTLENADGTKQKIEATENGILTEILVEEGAKVFVGSELVRYTPKMDDGQVVVCYVPLSEVAQLKKDMKVLLYPVAVDSQKYGHMEANIYHIDQYPASTNTLGYVLGTDNLVADQFVSNGPVVAVTCKIKSDTSTKSGYYWSSENGKDLTVSNTTYVSAKILVSEDAPITKLISNLKEKLEG